MAQLNIRIDEDARAGLDSYAEARGMATGDLVRHLIDQVIKDPRAAGAEGYVNPYNHARPATLSYVERRTLAMQHRILAMLGTRPTPETSTQRTHEAPTPAAWAQAGRAVEDQWGGRHDPSDLADGDAGSHLCAAEALEHGYTTEYTDLFVAMEPELSDQACQTVRDILTMFRITQSAWSQLAPDEQQAIERTRPHAADRLRFRGLDANDPVESRLLGYARYLIRRGLYVDLREAFDEDHDHGDSHARRLPAYLRMLEVYELMWKDKQRQNENPFAPLLSSSFTAEDLAALAQASLLRKNRPGWRTPTSPGDDPEAS